MSIAGDPETLAELIRDCRDLPPQFRTTAAAAPRPPAPRTWTVDEAAHSQVADLDDYA